jgi:hypothetical protein
MDGAIWISFPIAKYSGGKKSLDDLEDATMAVYAKPHSELWFQKLEAFNPEQAAHTRKILQLAQRDDVCSVCGDDPATDYRLFAPPPAKEAVGTIRLCEDCRIIREMSGEKFLPLED